MAFTLPALSANLDPARFGLHFTWDSVMWAFLWKKRKKRILQEFNSILKHYSVPENAIKLIKQTLRYNTIK